MDAEDYIDAIDMQRKARKEGTIGDFIDRARRAQQEHVQKHDVQLQISDCVPKKA